MKKLFLFLIFSFLSFSSLYSQIKYGDHLLGATLGFSTKGSAVIWGANYEYEFLQSGIGSFGVGGLARFWKFSEKYNDSPIDISSIALGGQVNYNFNQIGPGKFVPFVGLFAGYQNVSTKYTSYNANSLIGIEQKYKSNFQMWVQAGFRFFFSTKVAGVMRLGLGNLDFSTVELGFDIKL